MKMKVIANNAVKVSLPFYISMKQHVNSLIGTHTEPQAP